jgi:hypothetical protein|eukprot:COSAG06_NODE_57_length_27525_cov_14.855279_30_plen_579_part_00
MNDTRTSISYVAPGKSMTMSGALHFACANGNARAVRALLRAGSDPEAVLDKAGNTALHVAAQKGQSALIELLLDAGADPNVVNSINDTPLHVGAANGHADVVTALLQGGAWFNVENSKGKVAREVAGTVFAASSRVAPKKRVLKAFKAYARNRTSSSRDSASEDSAPAPAAQAQPAAAYEPAPPSPLPPAQQPSLLQAQQLAISVAAELRHIFVRHNVSLISAFEMLDTNGDGIINADELSQALRALQIELTESEMQSVMAVADNEMKGGIDYREFVSQFVLLAQQEAAQQAAEADADREVAQTMRYQSPPEPEEENLSPQIRGGSAPAAPMGASRASSEADSLSLPFGGGLSLGLSSSTGTGGTPGSGSGSGSEFIGREDFEQAQSPDTPSSQQGLEEGPVGGEEYGDAEETTGVPSLTQLEDYLMEVLMQNEGTAVDDEIPPPTLEAEAEADTAAPAAESAAAGKAPAAPAAASVGYCISALRECGIGLRDEEIEEMLQRVPALNESTGDLDLKQVAQTAAEMILILLKSSTAPLPARAPSADPGDQRPQEAEAVEAEKEAEEAAAEGMPEEDLAV